MCFNIRSWQFKKKEEKNMFKLPRLSRTGLVLLLGCAIFLSLYLLLNTKTAASAKNILAKTAAKNIPTKTADIHHMPNKQQTTSDKKPAPINWLVPSSGTYPVIGPNEPIWIKVSKAAQKVYIMNGSQVIYTMVCSTGLDTNPDTSTPEGTFYIQHERGISFYNPNEKEGAEYWVSWKNHGEFLFHSVATDKNGAIIPSEAAKLGHKASHGCIRLTVPDAKWIYDNIKYNTKVVIG